MPEPLGLDDEGEARLNEWLDSRPSSEDVNAAWQLLQQVSNHQGFRDYFRREPSVNGETPVWVRDDLVFVFQMFPDADNPSVFSVVQILRADPPRPLG